jgi:hypothetical protein
MRSLLFDLSGASTVYEYNILSLCIDFLLINVFVGRSSH